LLKLLHVARFHGDMHMIGVVVAIDGVVAHQRLSQIQRLDREGEQSLGVIPAYLGDELLLTHRQPKYGLAAAAARRPVGHLTCFQQSHLVAALGKM